MIRIKGRCLSIPSFAWGVVLVVTCSFLSLMTLKDHSSLTWWCLCVVEGGVPGGMGVVGP